MAQADDNVWDNELKKEVAMNEKENHLPNLSDKERAHALELAMKARKRRAVLKARMKSGELAFTDALNEEDAKRIEVVSLSKCGPGLGATQADAIRTLVNSPVARRVSGLGIRQREELTALEKNGWKMTAQKSKAL